MKRRVVVTGLGTYNPLGNDPETTWQKVIDNYPDALLLEEDQSMEAPLDWPRYIEVSCK